jgi:D-glycero-alpha-D-manno-heptose 1-phosphate guanylyltransferase
MEDVVGVVLAGGLGSRLRSVVDDRPKVLAEVNGRPFLSYILDQLCTAGVRRTVICIGYKGEQIREEFGDHYRDLEVAYSQETQLLGTAGALRQALPLLTGDVACVLNGDSYCAIDLALHWNWHRDREAEASLALVAVDDTSRYGSVEIDGDKRVVRFAEKQPGGKSGWINAGIYVLPIDLVNSLPEGEVVSLEREVLPHWIGKGLCGYQTSASFIDIGTPESYDLADQFFRR